MRKNRFMHLRLVLCACALLLVGSTAALGANVTGTVVRYHDNLPLAGALVTLGNAATLTDRHGTFHFSDTNLGSNVVTVQLAGREIHNQPIAVKSQDDTIKIVVDIKDGVLFEEDFELFSKDFIGTWVPYSAAHPTGQVTNQKARTGRQSFLIDDQDERRFMGIRSVKIPAVPGKTYSVSFWMMLTEGTTNLFFECFDADDKQVARDVYNAKTIDADWKQVTLTLTAPENAVSIGMLFHFSKPALGTLYIDDVKIYEVR